MFDFEGEPNPIFALIRATKHLVAVLVVNGWSNEQIRAEVFERANLGVPEGDSVAFALIRSVRVWPWSM